MPQPPSSDDRRRALRRVAGVVLLALGLYFLSNSAVMLFGGRSGLADEAPWLIPGLVLAGAGGWLMGIIGRRA